MAPGRNDCRETDVVGSHKKEKKGEISMKKLIAFLKALQKAFKEANVDFVALSNEIIG